MWVAPPGLFLVQAPAKPAPSCLQLQTRAGLTHKAPGMAKGSRSAERPCLRPPGLSGAPSGLDAEPIPVDKRYQITADRTAWLIVVMLLSGDYVNQAAESCSEVIPRFL